MIFVKTRTLLIIFGVFYLTEGKACPETTRPHKTRCEMYYKCMELPTKKHVWIPEPCEKGLVYEHNLKMCVLPGDDWECTLGDLQLQKIPNNNLVRSKNRAGMEQSQDQKKPLNKESDVYIVSNGDEESTFVERSEDGNVEIILKSNIGDEENEEDLTPYESSGDGEDFSDGFMKATNKEGNEILSEMHEVDIPSINDEASIEKTSTTKVDPSLTAHLQRLSQLIDGLKKTYQNRDKEQTELTPDQLNAFLAHFNIKNKFDSLDVETMHGNYEEESPASSTAMPMTVMFSNSSMKSDFYEPILNRTKIYKKFGNKLKPETKVVLTNSVPKPFGLTGFSNSQIVVNRPEGSVLFRLPPYGNEGHYIETSMQYDHTSPKISEETLKTVLELSKQMIANQNVPKVIPNPAYYAQPIIQPLFLSPSSYLSSGQSSINGPFSAFFGTSSSANNNFPDHNSNYDRSPIMNYNKQQFGHKNPQRPSGSYNGKPGTTIIHNNVIPVHVTSTSSGEKEVIDSYGQSLGVYPPLGGNNGNNGYTLQVTHQYENNKFVTTVRPYVTTTNQYASGQYPSPYTDGSGTTIRPPLEFQPTPNTIAQYYTPSPHLSENNVNSLFKPPNRFPTLQHGNVPQPIDINRPDSTHSKYPQLERPSSYQSPNKLSPFPPQIDPSKVSIYPNSEKVESMETEDDHALFNNYGSSSSQHNKLHSNVPQYNGGQQSMADRPSPLSGYSNNGNKNPYMPRPQTSGYGGNIAQNSNKPKVPTYGDGAQLVNIGGNFISYDAFQNSILPLMGQTGTSSNGELGNIEVISCQTGIRQPNTTDCTRYYVCSKKDGKVLSYSCPPYTAFNAQTRICDARTYANCSPDAIVSSYTVSENKRVQLEAIQAINEAKRRREEALKAQNLANLLQQYNAQLSVQQPVNIVQSNFDSGASDKDMLNSYIQQAAAMTASTSSTTPKPKKRKYYCKEGDKVPDQTSIYNYFVCYKNAQGMMKGHKMTCLKGLLFCPMTSTCALPSKCT